MADARLIRGELERCRAIVGRMSASAGQSIGELPAPTIFQLVATVRKDNSPVAGAKPYAERSS